MDTQDSIFPYVKSENQTILHGQEIYLEDSKEHLKTLLQNEERKHNPYCLKTEDMEIKSEEDKFGSRPGCDGDAPGSETSQNQETHKVKAEAKKYKCDLCMFETNHKHARTNHMRSHKNFVELGMCDQRKNNSREKKYNCEKCDYKTNYEPYFEHHRTEHESNPKAQMHVKGCSSPEIDTACSAKELVPFEIEAVDMDVENHFLYIKSEIDAAIDQPEMYFMEMDKEHLSTDANMSEIDKGSTCIKTEKIGET